MNMTGIKHHTIWQRNMMEVFVMNRPWGPYSQDPFHLIPPSFPNKFPFNQQPSAFPNMYKSPYEYFQKPPIPLGGFNQHANWKQGGGHFKKGANPLISSFQNANGQMDFDKIFSTVGQLVNTVNQVTPLVKQVGSIMKGFK
jgi:hypothetical protein